MHQVRRRQRGTSLIEVLTATALLGIVLGIGVPNLVRLRAPYASASAARQVAADLQAARLRAIARNARVRVVFADTTYRIEREAGLVWSVEGGARTLPPSATVAVAPADPVFDSRGMLAAPVTITVEAPNAAAHTVAVNVLGHTTLD
jgi:prepilin-type N-terminal cleavage/methylation domain-containing protein